MDEQHPVTRAIRERIDAHEGAGAAQWYVDEHSIDCDADQFWAVVDEAVRASVAAAGEPCPTILRPGSVIEIRRPLD